VVAIALAIGFQPDAGVLDWLGVVALLVAFMAAISWVATAFGLLAKSAEAAGAFSFFVMFLPYLSSAFVPTQTMPGALRWIGEHGPITPLVETLRALMTDIPAQGHALAAALWCGGLLVAGMAAAALLFRRR
jgi:ABC-2 type transport system permease protein